MDPQTREKLLNEIDVIINCAASVDMSGSLHEMLQVDYFGPKRMLDFAQQCKKQIVFGHVSTAYVNSNQKEFSYVEEKIYPFAGSEDFEVQIERIIEQDPEELEKNPKNFINNH